MFVLSVGGFHPAFREMPDDLRDMRRMTIALLSGDNPRLTVQTYFAVTSNTVQNGARVELYAEACGFNIYGFLGYDLLVQFNPLHFVATISAGHRAARGHQTCIAGISVHGELSGPAPWNAKGEASLEILFFEISVGFNETWGDDAPPDPVEIENVTRLVTRRARTTTATGGRTLPPTRTTGVSVREARAARRRRSCCSPSACSSVSQKVVPLGFPLQKFGNKKPDVDRFELTTALAGGAGGARGVRGRAVQDAERLRQALGAVVRADAQRPQLLHRRRHGDRRPGAGRGRLRAQLRPPLDRDHRLRRRRTSSSPASSRSLAGGTSASKNAFSKARDAGGVQARAGRRSATATTWSSASPTSRRTPG